MLEVTAGVSFLTPTEMAAKLRISLRTLQQMLKDGTAPPHHRLGSKVLFLVRSEPHAGSVIEQPSSAD